MTTTQHWRLSLSAAVSLLFVVGAPALAGTQYWNPTTTAKGAGTGVWDTSVGAWANTTSGTNAPVLWNNGNDANFTLNSGVNTAVVNNVSVAQLYFQDGTSFTFQPGTGPLTMTGPLINVNNLPTFNTDITLAADQVWDVRRTTTVNGTLTGPYMLKKIGGSYLVLSNANNNIGGLFLDSHYVRAYGGGNALGGPDAALTLGSPEQTNIAKLELYPLAGQSETAWAIGSLTANGFGEVNFKSSSDAVTNRVAFGDLERTNRGVLSLKQEASAFNIRQAVTFSNANAVVVNGMLPPWVATQASANFLGYDGMVKDVTYKTTTPDTWSATDIVNNTSTRTLDADAAVYAMRASADLTIPTGMTLTNTSGGLILAGGSIRGDGTLNAGTNELIVYSSGNTAIYPAIVADGLTVWGGGTLTVSNITWSGDTYLQQGNLKAIIAQNTVYTNNMRGALGNNGNPGEFIKDGPAALTLLNSDSNIPKFSWMDGASFSLIDASLSTAANISVPQDGFTMQVTNSYLRFGNNTSTLLQTATEKNNTQILVSLGSKLDAGGKGGVRIGNGAGSGNLLVVDGGGITGGAVITNMVTQDAKGLGIGMGAGASNNTIRLINGGQIWDQATVNNAGNNIGVGTGANNNLLEVIGGEGFVTTMRKGTGNTIGSGAATGNVVRVDAKGFSGSAEWLAPANDAFTVGSSGGFENALYLLDGAKLTGSSLICGSDANSNRIEIAGANTEWKGNGGGAQFTIGVGNSEGNTVVISEGAYVWNFTTWQGGIGGRGPDLGPTPGKISIGNKLIIKDGGRFSTANKTYVGHQVGAGAAAFTNQVLITGQDALWTSSDYIYLGASSTGSKAIGNRFIVENEGTFTGSRRFVIGSLSTVDGTAANDNGLIIRSGGTVRVPYHDVHGVHGLEIGSAVTNNAIPVNAENNFCLVTDNGVLDVPVLYILSPGGNYIRIENGGVWQLSGRTSPTIKSQQFGDISMNNGIVAFAEGASFTVRDNWNNASWTNVQFTGSNGLRLNNITLSTAAAQNYLFDPNISPTNWAFLQMVNGTTVYRTSTEDTGSLTIGQSLGSGGEMLCSNTTASVELPFVLNGDLTLYNSTLTFTKSAEINGDVFIDLDALPVTGTALVAQDALTLGASSTLHLSGTFEDGKVLMTYAGALTGKFTVTGLPNNYTLAYGAEGPGTVSLLKSPSIIIVR